MEPMIQQVLEETDAEHNPYFTALRDGSFAREDFLETQIQFYYAVVFFSRPMAAVAAKIPSPEMRVEVMRNVWEEHGEGDTSHMHGRTIRLLLQRLGGIELADIESRVLWPEMRAFNTTLIGCALQDDWEVSTACFGMIERMFVDISNWLGQGIVDRGWLASDQVVHYSLHKELDLKHSADFFAVLAAEVEKLAGTQEHTQLQYRIMQGLRLGATIFNQLYEGMYRARTRRWKADVWRPQSHIYRA